MTLTPQEEAVLDIATTAFGNMGRKVGEWQKRFLINDAEWQIYNKSRQIGFSDTSALKALAEAMVYQASSSFISHNQIESMRKIEYMKAAYEKLPSALQISKLKDTESRISFSNGASVISLPSTPRAVRGLSKSNIYIDEQAHSQFAKLIYEAATPLLLHETEGQKLKLTAASTPLGAGEENQFWSLFSNKAKYPDFFRIELPWWVFELLCKDIVRAQAEAPSMTTEERVLKFGTRKLVSQYRNTDKLTFSQEYECAFSDENLYFFPFDLILRCSRDYPYYRTSTELLQTRKVNDYLFMGCDVGRFTDKTELMVVQLVDGRAKTIANITIAETPLPQQMAMIRKIVGDIKPTLFFIDKNGIGLSIYEDLIMSWPSTVVGSSFSNSDKKEIVLNAKKMMECNEVEIPQERDLQVQIHSVEKGVTRTGLDRYEGGDYRVGGHHADKFWAWGLALLGVKNAGFRVVEISDDLDSYYVESTIDRQKDW